MAAIKPESQALKEVKSVIEAADPVLAALAALLRAIAEVGTPDQLFGIAKMVDLMLEDAQKRLVMRN